MAVIPAGYKQTEVGVIPEDWEFVAAGEIGRFRGGNGFPLKFQGEFSGAYPFFKVSDMNNEGNETFMRTANNYICETTRKTLGATLFSPNSIVFAKVGAAVFLERKKILAQQSCLDNNMAAYELDDSKADYRFVHFRLLHTKFGDLVSTTALPSLSGGALSQIRFPLPPLQEQRAIAATLSDVDALLAKLDQLIAKKRDLKQATMQQLLTGQTRLPGFSGAWEVKRLGDVSQLMNGFAFKSSTYDEFGCYKVVTIANVQDGFMSIDVCNKVARLPQDIQFHQRLIQGDILISMTGNVGRVCRVCDDDCLLNQRVGKLVPNGIDDRFLFAVLRQPSFLVSMVNKAKGGAQGNLSKVDITEYELKLPSREEQTAIATILSDMDAELAALEARRDKTRTLKQGMMQDLLTGRIRLV